MSNRNKATATIEPPTEATAPQTEQQQPPTESPTDSHNVHSREQKRKLRAWCVARIVDYRLQALAQADPEDPESPLEFCDIGLDTFATCDREEAYQHARAEGGLLMSVNGLPGGARLAAFHAKVRDLIASQPDAEPTTRQTWQGNNHAANREAVRRAKEADQRARGVKVDEDATEGDDVPF